jgi:hypothetical protein
VPRANGDAHAISLDDLDSELDEPAFDLPTLPNDFSRAEKRN